MVVVARKLLIFNLTREVTVQKNMKFHGAGHEINVSRFCHIYSCFDLSFREAVCGFSFSFNESH